MKSRAEVFDAGFHSEVVQHGGTQAVDNERETNRCLTVKWGWNVGSSFKTAVEINVRRLKVPPQKQTIHLVAAHCPFCGEYGNVGFRKTSGEEIVVLACDECGAIWLSPMNISAENADAPQPPKFEILGTSSHLGEGSRWATLEEIESAGLSQYVANSYQS